MFHQSILYRELIISGEPLPENQKYKSKSRQQLTKHVPQNARLIIVKVD